jgi:hypothetical protein
MCATAQTVAIQQSLMVLSGNLLLKRKSAWFVSSVFYWLHFDPDHLFDVEQAEAPASARSKTRSSQR